jgi:hypothetical protein
MATENKLLYMKLKRNFFTHSEAMKLSHPKINQYTQEPQDVTTDDYKALINKAITSRRNFRNNLKTSGFTDTEIAKSIHSFYRQNKDTSPFDFIRLEYMVTPTANKDYHKSVGLRNRDLNKAKISRAKVRGWAKSVIGETYKSHQRKSHFEGKIVVKNQVNKESKLAS